MNNTQARCCISHFLLSPPAALADANDESLRRWLHAGGAPPNLPFDTAAVMLRRQLNDKTSDMRREIEALNWTEPGAPLRAMALAGDTRVEVPAEPIARLIVVLQLLLDPGTIVISGAVANAPGLLEAVRRHLPA